MTAIFLFCLSFFLFFTPLRPMMKEKETKKKHIIFDMEFMVQPCQDKVIKKLGISSSFSSLLSGKFSQESSVKELFGLVKISNIVEIDNNENEIETLTWEKQIVPTAMVGWLKDKVSCATMLEKVQSTIEKSYNFTSRPISIAKMAFDPSTCVDILEICQPNFDLMMQLQKEGHTIHILGNWHSDVRKKVIEDFSCYFSKINGTVLVSGDFGEVKCQEHSTLYKLFLKKISASPKDVCCIETPQSVNLTLTKENPNNTNTEKSIDNELNLESIVTIFAKPTDSNFIKKEFQSKGLLSK